MAEGREWAKTLISNDAGVWLFLSLDRILVIIYAFGLGWILQWLGWPLGPLFLCQDASLRSPVTPPRPPFLQQLQAELMPRARATTATMVPTQVPAMAHILGRRGWVMDAGLLAVLQPHGSMPTGLNQDREPVGTAAVKQGGPGRNAGIRSAVCCRSKRGPALRQERIWRSSLRPPWC